MIQRKQSGERAFTGTALATATLPKTKAKFRYEFFIIVKSKCISPLITQKVNSVYL
jgi:hypothetical protein